MNSNSNSKHNLSQVIIVVVLYILFSLLAMTLVVVGGRVYKNLDSSTNDNFDMRTTLSYVATKIRQGDERDAIHVDNKLGVPALVISERIDNSTYETWIYHYEGALYENYVETSVSFLASEGTKLLDIAEFNVEISDNGKIILSSTNKNGRTEQLIIVLRTEMQGGLYGK